MAWCKQRALECLEHSGISDAVASMGSDLNKHPETADHPGTMLGILLLAGGHMKTAAECRRWIEGFN